MSELTLRLDGKAIKNIHELQRYYGVESEGELIRKALKKNRNKKKEAA